MYDALQLLHDRATAENNQNIEYKDKLQRMEL